VQNIAKNVFIKVFVTTGSSEQNTKILPKSNRGKLLNSMPKYKNYNKRDEDWGVQITCRLG